MGVWQVSTDEEEELAIREAMQRNLPHASPDGPPDIMPVLMVPLPLIPDTPSAPMVRMPAL